MQKSIPNNYLYLKFDRVKKVIEIIGFKECEVSKVNNGIDSQNKDRENGDSNSVQEDV